MTGTIGTNGTLHPPSLPGQTGHHPLGVSRLSRLRDVPVQPNRNGEIHRSEKAIILALDLGTNTGWAMPRAGARMTLNTHQLRSAAAHSDVPAAILFATNTAPNTHGHNGTIKTSLKIPSETASKCGNERRGNSSGNCSGGGLGRRGRQNTLETPLGF